MSASMCSLLFALLLNPCVVMAARVDTEALQALDREEEFSNATERGEAGTGKLCKQGIIPPKACCCKLVQGEKDCPVGNFFYPKAVGLPSNSRTCDVRHSWCCQKSENHLCSVVTSRQVVRLRLASFDNLLGKTKVYLKVFDGQGAVELTNLWTDQDCDAWVNQQPSRCNSQNYRDNCAKKCNYRQPETNILKTSPVCPNGEKPCSLNNRFYRMTRNTFNGKMRFQVKHKNSFFGATTIGDGSFSFGEKDKKSNQVPVVVDLGEHGKLTVELDFTAGFKESQFDNSLCVAPASPGNAAGDNLPSTPEAQDDFTLDSLFDDHSGGSSNTPVFLDILDEKPNQHAGNGKVMARDYTLIIDRSGSMGVKDEVHMPDIIGEKYGGSGMKTLSRWTQVEAALRFLTPYVVDEDPDGIGVYFFSSSYDEHGNICGDKDVMNLFKQSRPGGGTYLANVLKEAMEPDTIGRAETIFVLTDGAASDRNDVKRVITQKTRAMCKNEELSISFIQVGNDKNAASYLNSLDDDLEKEGAKFDIVDAMTTDEMQGKSFLDVIQLSLHD